MTPEQVADLALKAGRYRRERDEALERVAELEAQLSPSLTERACSDLVVEMPDWVGDEMIRRLDAPSPLLRLFERSRDEPTT